MTKILGPFLCVIAIAVAGSAIGPLGAIPLVYAAFAILVAGLSWRVVRWSLSPVPFRIPTVCGQEKSLPWIRSSWLESPHSTTGVIARMALEVLAFRSLFRNTSSRIDPGPKLVYRNKPWLWLGAIAFHASLLVILLRHLRLLVEPAPKLSLWLDRLDGFFQVGAPPVYLTDCALVLSILYLLQRRLRDPRIRYFSLFTDYFALFLLLAVAVSGVWMRYFGRTDIVAVKQFALGLATLRPVAPANAGAWFYVHLALVSTLAAYLPFSKLVHLAGVFLSPTRNLANNNRMKRHVNPWNAPVKVHTYEEWEEEFHDKMAAAGLPLERR